ncbi:hypothetical protein [Streptomyces bohaiensis]|uniref:hypothetical protein n=1 Tax=Streptomyces bohaiensis TaxID=1431344 RepID=UPI003B7835D2
MTALGDAHQRANGKTAEAAGRAARQAWRRIDPADLRGSWRAQLAVLLAAIHGAQGTVAGRADGFLDRTVPERDGPPPVARLIPATLVGTTVDGRPLLPLLLSPLAATLAAMAAGTPVLRALVGGGAMLELTVRTLISDTARAADLAGMIARPAVTSYVRTVSGGACGRCLVLAGREYGLSSGFARHPRCNCGMEPVTRSRRPEPVDARDLYERMDDDQRRKAFGHAGAEAIADGADIASVVNARRRGATTTIEHHGRRIETTTEGQQRGEWRRREFYADRAAGRIPASRSMRGYRPAAPRMTPAEIYRQAAGDRDEAIRLLRRFAYI